MRAAIPSDTENRQFLIAELYSQARRGAGEAFTEWFLDFERVHGELERKRRLPQEQLARTYGLNSRGLDLPALMFAIETYFACWLSGLAYVVSSPQVGDFAEMPNDDAPTSELGEWLYQLCSGQLIASNGIRRFGLGNLFTWFIAEGRKELLGRLASDLALTRSVVAFSSPDTVTDLVRRTYHQLVPKQVRHAIGAYHTPRWLAEHILRSVGYAQATSRRLLDPTCGSGTFLSAAVLDANRAFEDRDNGATPPIPAIVGFDVSPIAVLAAETNLVATFSRFKSSSVPAPVSSLPVFLCDSVSFPRSRGLLNEGPNRTLTVRIGARDFSIPHAVLNPTSWPALVASLIEGLRKEDSDREWLAVARHACGTSDIGDLLSLFHFVRSKSRSGLLGLYARMLEDAPQPLFEPRFDFVVGNPPWVNWENYPPANRESLADLWQELGLFDLRGMEKAFSKEDMSVLVAAVSCDRYLRDGGVLGFLMPQTVFKSSLNGRGFRRFRLSTDGSNLAVVQVDDLTELQPFEGVSNRTTALLLEKGRKTTYPVRYRRWRGRNHVRSIVEESSLEEVDRQVEISEEVAFPVDEQGSGSPWVTVPGNQEALIRELTGTCPYRARAGVFTGGANGVFYLDVLEELPNGLLRVRNDTRRAKRLVQTVETQIESTYIQPLLRGRNVDQWKYSVEGAVLLPHTLATAMNPVREEVLRIDAPLTLAYLTQFKTALQQRRGFVGWEKQFLEQAFYACQRIGSYTFAPYKVVWRYISRTFTCAVVEPHFLGGLYRPVIPHEKLMLIGFDDRTEAYYVCGLLSSSPIRVFLESRMVGTQIAPHVLAKLRIPLYDPGNETHVQLAKTVMEATGVPRQASESRPEVDELAADVLGLSTSSRASGQSSPSLNIRHIGRHDRRGWQSS